MSINDKKFDEIVLSSPQDAEAVRETMRKICDRYGYVTVSDYLELVGISSSFTDTKVGWSDLSKVEIVPVSDGFVLNLPEPTLLSSSGTPVVLNTDYSRTFDAQNTYWSKDPKASQIFLLAQQNYVNDVLQARGHVFLNEVYDVLGFERTRDGVLVGWLKNHGDGYIDFKITEIDQEHVPQPAFSLTFNVVGAIYDKI